jgi:hypothetical protein
MPTIIYSPTSQLSQVEDFPADCERTVKGALYVRPGATAVVSDGEAARLQARGIVFTVVGGPKPVPVAALPAPKPPSKPSAPIATLPVPSAMPISSAPAGGAASSTEK